MIARALARCTRAEQFDAAALRTCGLCHELELGEASLLLATGAGGGTPASRELKRRKRGESNSERSQHRRKCEQFRLLRVAPLSSASRVRTSSTSSIPSSIGWSSAMAGGGCRLATAVGVGPSSWLRSTNGEDEVEAAAGVALRAPAAAPKKPPEGAAALVPVVKLNAARPRFFAFGDCCLTAGARAAAAARAGGWLRAFFAGRDDSSSSSSTIALAASFASSTTMSAFSSSSSARIFFLRRGFARDEAALAPQSETHEEGRKTHGKKESMSEQEQRQTAERAHACRQSSPLDHYSSDLHRHRSPRSLPFCPPSPHRPPPRWSPPSSSLERVASPLLASLSRCPPSRVVSPVPSPWWWPPSFGLSPVAQIHPHQSRRRPPWPPSPTGWPRASAGRCRG